MRNEYVAVLATCKHCGDIEVPGAEVLVLHGQAFRFALMTCECGEDVHVPLDEEAEGRMLAAGLRFLDRSTTAELLEARRAFLGEVTFGDFVAECG